VDIVEVEATDGRFAAVVARDRQNGEVHRFPAAAAFVFIGLSPNDSFLGDRFARDAGGFLQTSATMETSVPGVFAAGDVRAGSTKQLGSAVGEGIAALLMARQHLAARRLVAVAPASHIKTIVSLAPTITSPGGSLSGTGALFLTGAAQGIPKVDLSAILSPEADALVPDVEKKCLGGLSKADSWGGIAPSKLLKSDADQADLQAVLTANDPETLKLTVPVLLLQGSADTAVFPIFTDGLNASLVKNGASVEYKTYPGKGHYDVFGVAEPDATAWLVAHAK